MPILTDADIHTLIQEPKNIPEGLGTNLRMSERNNHWNKEFEIKCDSPSRFVIKVRQSCVNPLNFSVVLGYMLPGSYRVFRLRRYNGKSHMHTNTLEKESFYDFHIHAATERYQIPGFNEDHFAERTTNFYDLKSAIDCLVGECGFRSPMDGTPLFPSE
jgi:hypothetical protein